MFEEFIFETTAKIAFLLQARIKESSTLSNELYQKTSISTEHLQKIQFETKKLDSVFDFVQQISAEFKILVSYLDIDNAIYADLSKGINDNYRQLLTYLKTLRFIQKDNTIEFTMPSSTNMKNIDLVRYSIEREDRLTGGKQTYEYDFWVRGGLKIDFSAGLFASGLVDHDYQKHIVGQRVEDQLDSIQIKRQQKGSYGFGVGGMVNIVPRLGASWITPGVSFGAIYSTNEKLQVLATISLHFGKTERLVAHWGVAAGSAAVIDLSQHQINRINDETFGLRADFDSFTTPTIDRFQFRPVFGLTYNLSKQNSLQAVVDARRK